MTGDGNNQNPSASGNQPEAQAVSHPQVQMAPQPPGGMSNFGQQPQSQPQTAQPHQLVGGLPFALVGASPLQQQLSALSGYGSAAPNNNVAVSQGSFNTTTTSSTAQQQQQQQSAQQQLLQTLLASQALQQQQQQQQQALQAAMMAQQQQPQPQAYGTLALQQAMLPLLAMQQQQQQQLGVNPLQQQLQQLLLYQQLMTMQPAMAAALLGGAQQQLASLNNSNNNNGAGLLPVPQHSTTANIPNMVSIPGGMEHQQQLQQQQQQQLHQQQQQSVDSSLNAEWAEPFSAKSKKEPPFPLKLHQILCNPEFADCITWNPSGRSWRILKPPVFEQVVIPLYFRHAKYASFMRQVNGWGFKRIVSGHDHNSYYHELFIRENPQACLQMKRVRKGTSVVDVGETDRQNNNNKDHGAAVAAAKKTDSGASQITDASASDNSSDQYEDTTKPSSNTQSTTTAQEEQSKPSPPPPAATVAAAEHSKDSTESENDDDDEEEEEDGGDSTEEDQNSSDDSGSDTIPTDKPPASYMSTSAAPMAQSHNTVSQQQQQQQNHPFQLPPHLAANLGAAASMGLAQPNVLGNLFPGLAAPPLTVAPPAATNTDANAALGMLGGMGFDTITLQKLHDALRQQQQQQQQQHQQPYFTGSSNNGLLLPHMTATNPAFDAPVLGHTAFLAAQLQAAMKGNNDNNNESGTTPKTL